MAKMNYVAVPRKILKRIINKYFTWVCCGPVKRPNTHTETGTHADKAEKELNISSRLPPSRCQSPSWAPRRRWSPRKSKDCANNMQKSTSSFRVIRILMTYFLGLPFGTRQLAVSAVCGSGSTTCAASFVWYWEGECLKAFAGPADKHLERKQLARLHSHSMKLSFIIFLNYIPGCFSRSFPRGGGGETEIKDLRVI